MRQSILLSSAKLIRRLIRTVTRLPKLIVYLMFACLPAKLKKRLAVTYANDRKTDGLGAQLQRLVAIRALAMRLNLNYLHSQIVMLAIHPLDPFANESQVNQFLKKVNKYFNLDSSIEQSWAEEEFLFESLSLSTFVRIYFRSIIRRKNILIRVVEPYAVMELLPNDYKRVIPFFIEFPHAAFLGDDIVMHYRYGVGNSVIQPGEKLPRQMDLMHFRKVIQRIPAKYTQTLRVLRVLTDAPEFETSFRPQKNQLHLWEGTPNFHNGSVLIQPLSFKESLGDLGLDLVVDFGGDAVDSVLRMSNSRVLILSRSSLSYVGALFNQNAELVYSAPNFWHPRMKSWR
jgi:hypothetical protein